MGNVPKRQQPDHRTDNRRRSPTGLQCSESLASLYITQAAESYKFQSSKTNKIL